MAASLVARDSDRQTDKMHGRMVKAVISLAHPTLLLTHLISCSAFSFINFISLFCVVSRLCICIML